MRRLFKARYAVPAVLVGCVGLLGLLGFSPGPAQAVGTPSTTTPVTATTSSSSLPTPIGQPTAPSVSSALKATSPSNKTGIFYVNLPAVTARAVGGEEGLSRGDEGGREVDIEDAGLVGRRCGLEGARDARRGGLADRGGERRGRRRCGDRGGGRRRPDRLGRARREAEQAEQADATHQYRGYGVSSLEQSAHPGSHLLEKEEAAVEADPDNVHEVPVVADALEDRCLPRVTLRALQPS